MLVYCNLAQQLLSEDDSGESEITLPKFFPGVTREFSFRFLELINGQYVETDLPLAGIRCSLGLVDERPTSGGYKFDIGTGITAVIDSTLLAPHVQEILNATMGATGNLFSVEQLTGGYRIRRASGADFSLSVSENMLSPVSFVRIFEQVIDDVHWKEIRLTRAPLAFSDSFERVLPKPPTITTVQDGFTDPSGVFFSNEVQALSIPPDFRAAYRLRRGFAKTQLMDINDDASVIKENLDAILAPENALVRTTTPRPFLVHIEFQGELEGEDVDPLEIEVASPPPGDWTIRLNLNRAECYAALRELPEIEVVFECVADVYIDPDDESAGTKPILLFSRTETLARPLVFPDLSTIQDIDWLRPPSDQQYVPFTTDQVLTGEQGYIAVIGNGSASEFSIPHNLDSNAVWVVVRENFAGGRILRDDEFIATVDSANEMTISFVGSSYIEDDPIGVNALAVMVRAGGPKSVFQSHTHTIAQIEDLSDILDDLGSRVTELEEILPQTGAGATSASSEGLVTVIPTEQEIVWYRGEDVDQLWTDSGIDDAKLPRRAPFMLPAVHDATVTGFSGGTDPVPITAGAYENTGDDVPSPGGGGTRSQIIPANGYVGADGRTAWPATRSGTTKSYFPTAYERTLWAMAINDKMLAVNRTFEATFGIQLQLLRASCKAQWVLSIELGTFSADTTPATTGLNLANVDWQTPVFSQPIVLSRLMQSHFFGIRIKREAATIKLDQQIYGVWSGNNAAAPASANFAIRARLDRFDTENRDNPTGWVAWRLIGALDIEETGKMSTKPATARIL